MPVRRICGRNAVISIVFLYYSSSRAHSATPRFRITTATLGCDSVLGVDLRTADIYTVSMFHVAASYKSLAATFLQSRRRTHSAASPFPKQVTFASAVRLSTSSQRLSLTTNFWLRGAIPTGKRSKTSFLCGFNKPCSLFLCGMMSSFLSPLGASLRVDPASRFIPSSKCA